MITEILDSIDSIMYYPILIIVMALAGIYFTVLTKGVQIRLFPEYVDAIEAINAAHCPYNGSSDNTSAEDVDFEEVK